MDYAEESLKKHAEWKGKIEVVSRVKVENAEDFWPIPQGLPNLV